MSPGVSGLKQALLGGDALGGTRQVRRRLSPRPAVLRGDLSGDQDARASVLLVFQKRRKGGGLFTSRACAYSSNFLSIFETTTGDGVFLM